MVDLEEVLWISRNKKLKKHKVVCKVMYLGTNYNGSQILKNLDCSTIEGCLQVALFKSGAIFYKNIDSFSKLGLKRTSRTDKGVHSACSVFSLKIQNPLESLKQLRRKINHFLPLDIRLISLSIFPRKFDCYHSCVDRTYCYVIPSKCFLADSSKEYLSFDDVLAISEILRLFLGTHFYHNFTQKSKIAHKNFLNTTVFQRYIKRFQISKIFRYQSEEFVSLELTGQSFIYNQIRKMITFVVSSFRKKTLLAAQSVSPF